MDANAGSVPASDGVDARLPAVRPTVAAWSKLVDAAPYGKSALVAAMPDALALLPVDAWISEVGEPAPPIGSATFASVFATGFAIGPEGPLPVPAFPSDGFGDGSSSDSAGAAVGDSMGTGNACAATVAAAVVADETGVPAPLGEGFLLAVFCAVPLISPAALGEALGEALGSAVAELSGLAAGAAICDAHSAANVPAGGVAPGCGENMDSALEALLAATVAAPTEVIDALLARSMHVRLQCVASEERAARMARRAAKSGEFKFCR